MFKIYVDSEAPHIGRDNFCIKELSGRKELFFSCYNTRIENNSVMYFGVTLGFYPCPAKDLDSEKCVLFHINKEMYIAAERGIRGYKALREAYKCKAVFEDGACYITVTRISDALVTDKVFKVYDQNSYGLISVFNKNAGLRLLDEYKYLQPRTALNIYENTDFINLPEGGEYKKLKVSLDNLGRYVLSTDSPITPITEDYGGVLKENVILWQKNERSKNSLEGNSLEIYEIVGFCHDYMANLMAVMKTILRYPHDAMKIKERFKEFYSKYCLPDKRFETVKRLSAAEEVPLINHSDYPGDGLVIQRIHDWLNEPVITGGIIQFAKYRGEDFRIRPVLDAAHTYCSLMNDDNLFNIAYYKYKKIVRHQGKYYGVFTYEGETGFTDWSDIPDTNKPVFNAAQLMLLCGAITSIPVSRDEYNNKREQFEP